MRWACCQTGSAAALENTVQKTITNFITQTTKETVALGVSPGSGEYDPTVQYNEAIPDAQRLAQYTGAFVSVRYSDEYGTGYLFYVIDEELRTMEYTEVVELGDTFKSFLINPPEGIEVEVTGTIPDATLNIREYKILGIAEASGGEKASYRFNLEMTRQRSNSDSENTDTSLKHFFYAFKERDLSIGKTRITQDYGFRGATPDGVYITGTWCERVSETTDFAALKAKAIERYNKELQERLEQQEESNENAPEDQTGGS